MKEQMRKKNILNLIKYHAENNDAGFKKEAYDIARYFDSVGDSELAQYIMALLSGTNTFVPQDSEYDMPLFSKVDLTIESALPLPVLIKNDIVGIINSIGHRAGVNKFLFEGEPGTGKTETAKQIARILERDLYAIDFDAVIDSKLGQTSKNMAAVFSQLQNLPHPEKVIILFDEIDAIALDRVNSNDVREMGRVTSSMLKGLDGLNDNIILIATTNLYKQFDKAMIRRFDAVVNFNRYSQDELIEVAESILNHFLIKFKFAGRNIRLFKKILSTAEHIPFPGDLRNVIKTSLAFSDKNNEYDYLKKIYESIDLKNDSSDLKALQRKGFTVREIEILTGVSKSQVSRELSI
ncbi:MAG: AAA+ family ATPase [Candidatus Nomurabacteria bacterium GW2011_GWA2_42_41]|nr:MAG: AAA+ family ATPase [Candidatus Nomurabacteria bacterium GW2011_GWA2_42_41]